jgi:polysaccharide export outer membrane protein
MLAGAAAPRADQTAVGDVRTEPGGSGPAWRIAFEGPIPEFTLSDAAGAVTLVLRETGLKGAAAAGIEASSAGGDTVLRFPARDSAVASVDVSSGAIVLRLRAVGAATAADTYRIGVNDVVSVGVFKNPELSGDFPCGADGSVSLPLVGSVPAKGRTEAELSAELAAAFSTYLVDPQVTVAVKLFQSQFVHVMGAIPRASRVPLKPGITVSDVLSEAGVALQPGQQVTLKRSGQPPVLLGQADVQAGAQSALRDGDSLIVEEPKYVLIQGEVRRPQRISLSQGMTLLQAIAMAEGLTEWASKREVRVLRRSASGEIEERVVDLRRVEAGKIEDLELQAGDKVLVKRRVF